jgi:AraC-like DNA-binding protein
MVAAVESLLEDNYTRRLGTALIAPPLKIHDIVAHMDISTVPVHYFNALLNSAQRHGLEKAQVLQHCGIESALIEGNRARMSSASFRRLCEYLIAELQDENGGMLSQRTKLGTFAMMCNAAINCPTLGQFLQRCIDFNVLVSDSFTLSLETEGEQACYSIIVEQGATDEEELIVMILLGVTHRLSNWAIGQTITLEAVDIMRELPGYAHEYNFLFMAPIRFGQETNSLRFAAKYLDMPIVQTEQELAQFLSTPAIHLMTDLDSGKSLAAKVRAMIKNDVGGTFPPVDTVAENLNLTAATLRRRLRREGSSYQQLKDDMRRDTAIYHLSRGTLSMDQVAESVGFSEPTSFFRAFKRWTGVTPRAYISRSVTIDAIKTRPKIQEQPS